MKSVWAVPRVSSCAEWVRNREDRGFLRPGAYRRRRCGARKSGAEKGRMENSGSRTSEGARRKTATRAPPARFGSGAPQPHLCVGKTVLVGRTMPRSHETRALRANAARSPYGTAADVEFS